MSDVHKAMLPSVIQNLYLFDICIYYCYYRGAAALQDICLLSIVWEGWQHGIDLDCVRDIFYKLFVKMTIITKPITEKKTEKLDVPLVEHDQLASAVSIHINQAFLHCAYLQKKVMAFNFMCHYQQFWIMHYARNIVT